MKLSAEQKKLFDALSRQQQLFCERVLQGEPATKAYQASGYTVKSERVAEAAASRLLSSVKVKSFIDSVREATMSSAIMSREEMLETLSTLARTNLTDLVEFSTYELGDGAKQSGWHIPDSILQDPVKLSAISELSAGKDGIKIKQHSRLQAMKQIADIQGYEAPKVIDNKSSDGSMSPKTLDPSKLSTEALKELMGAMNADAEDK